MIRKIIAKIADKIRNFIEKMVLNIINLMGSVSSLIIHTVFFVYAWLFTTQLFLTTVVSLEAIYLAILIQLSINFQTKRLEHIQENVEDIQENVEDIQENVEEIQGDVEEIQEDVEEINEDEENEDEEDEDLKEIHATMKVFQETLDKLMKEVVDLKKKQTKK
jgi:peptidoglycan hydrolase CwlO-like protein